jgi:N-methylhydantoinase A
VTGHKRNPESGTTRIGIDTGGTFTDIAVIDPAGRARVLKRPSTPSDPSIALLEAIQAVRAAGIDTANAVVVHGTTVATNALLERRGASTALITNAGFADLLEIGRQNRRYLYTFNPDRAQPLIDASRRYEVEGRLDWQGAEITPLDTATVESAVSALRAQGIESVAVCLLFSYLNPAHERAVGEILRAAGLPVSLSAEIAPEPREYERASTTVANAFVSPIMARYLRQVEAKVQVAGGLRVMQSNGGALTVREASDAAIKTVLSGPAGGLVASAHLARTLGIAKALTFDMGGTSTDVSILLNGRPGMVTASEISGMPIRTPMLDIETIGAGGGSLAFADAAGGLRVGPKSAGSDPGPVAYGKGECITVTDANLYLGRMARNLTLGGAVRLHYERVHTYMERLARTLGLDPVAAAMGILGIANSAMARALRRVSTVRGHDTHDAALICFGGAGGMHACALAGDLGMARIVVPRYPGAFSALGLAMADVRRDFVEQIGGRRDWDWSGAEIADLIAGIVRRLRHSAARAMAAEGGYVESLAVEMRYVRQSFSLPVELRSGGSLERLVADFHAAHHHRYGYADSREPVEAVAVRLSATAPVELAEHPWSGPAQAAKPVDVMEAVFTEGTVAMPVFRRAELALGQRIEGPALLIQDDATTLVEPGWSLETVFGGVIEICAGK